MFLGMAFFKTGILTGNASTKFMAGCSLVVWDLGLPVIIFQSVRQLLIIISTNTNTQKMFPLIFTRFKNVKIIRFFGLIMLMYKSGWFKWFFALFRPVGQMAFTNYLMQSLIGGLFFYGIGFELFWKTGKI